MLTSFVMKYNTNFKKAKTLSSSNIRFMQENKSAYIKIPRG